MADPDLELRGGGGGGVFQISLNTDANFVNLHIDKATKTRSDKPLRVNHTFYETNFKPKLFTANVECNGTVIKLPKTEKPIRFLNFKFSLHGGDLVFWFTFNLAVDFRPKMALTVEILSDKCTLYLGIALSTQFFFSSLVLGGLNLRSVICFAKQRVRSELTNKLSNNVTSVDEYSKIVTAQQLGDRTMHIMHISRLKYNS